MNLPADNGAYVLLLEVAERKRVSIGRLGSFNISPGVYAYVGSAFGAGGLRARIDHHIEATAAPHWHIDYLMAVAKPLEVWYARADRKLERDWVELLEREPRFSCPIPRFGSSGYRRSRTSHLFFTKRRPSFRWFERRVSGAFDSDIRVRFAVVATAERPFAR